MRFPNSFKLRTHRIVYCAVMFILTFVTTISIVGVAQAAGAVSGLVFRDYNANGVQDTNEQGVGGVTITAYGAANTVVATATSSAVQATLGTYSISWVSSDTRVRLEFSGLPGVAQPGAASTAAGGSGTSVQFVNAGATNVNYGINRPSDYCLATPNLRLVTTCFEEGPQNIGSPTSRVVVSHDYAGTPGSEANVALDTEVGTAWGIAYKRASGATPGYIFASAFAKRQAGYGPSGSGAIYAIRSPAGLPPNVTTLTTIPNTGTFAHNPANWQIDSTFYAAPGKDSLGDMDISEDGTTLYVINLADRQLYSVALTAGTPPTAGAPQARGIIGNPACNNGVYRPFGLGIRDGLVYVGGVCNAEDPAGTPADLVAYVFSFNPVTNVTAQVLTFRLDYARGCADVDLTYGNPVAPIPCRTGVSGSQADWQPWRDAWPNPDQTPPGSGFSPGLQQFFTYPQPMLAGIEFVGEDMVVSFRDRMGDQIGYLDNGPNGTFPTQLVTVTAGDILRAGPVAGGWQIEAGAAGTDFGPSPGANPPYSEQGPGNGEFYWRDDLPATHDETITGGIVQVPGAPDIAAEIMDPTGTFSAGTGWFSNGTGARSNSFTIIPATAPFGKGNGLGDLAALCDSAPIEIGNYVWFDANQNGIQDANEQPIVGVQVQLFNPNTNTVIATAVTDANGRYVFSSNPTNPSPGNTAFLYGLNITENTNYQVRIDTTQSNLTGYSLTTTNAGGATNDVRDSNGAPVGALAVATVTTGTAGQNNHTIDFGFYSPPYSLGNRVWFDDGRGGGGSNNGIQDGTEPGIDGVTVNLLDNLGNVIATTVTTLGGFYRFDNLAPGSYSVEIPASNFTGSGKLAGLTSSADGPTSATPNNDVDRDDNGLDVPVNGGIRSGTVTLGPPGPSEPTSTTGPDLGPGDNSPLLPAGRSNLTVDFGFFGTPINPPLTPPPGSNVPGPVQLDPAITKQVDPAFAQPGDEVRWTITLQNPHNVDIHNVSFVDNFPSQLEIISTSVDNNAGTLVVSGNSVTFSIVVINPGQSVHVHVLTRIRVGTPVPFIITNTVNLTNGLTGSATQILASASATVTSAGSLPATGFAPPWRDPLMVGIGVLFVLFGIRAVRGY